MEYLMDLINALEAEKEKLLNEKEENLIEIKKCDNKIQHYKYMVSRYVWGIKFRKQQIETYSRILESKASRRYSLLSLLSFLHYEEDELENIESLISKCKSDKDDLVLSIKTVNLGITFLLKDKKGLENRNEQIDLRISEIDKSLEAKRSARDGEKVYKLERRN